MKHEIILCDEWGAKPATCAIRPAGRPERIIFHHTAGHAPNLDRRPSESKREAVAYARAIQAFHMGPQRGWCDTGQSFLVARTGHIFEGRHGTVAALERGLMVVSAHCPGQNDQPGIEHEHYGSEEMPDVQFSATVWLHTWICQHARIRPTEVYGHGHFYPTECPGPLDSKVPQVRLAVARAMQTDPYSHVQGEMWRWFLWRDRGADPAERPLARVRAHVPPAWWARYARHRRGL